MCALCLSFSSSPILSMLLYHSLPPPRQPLSPLSLEFATDSRHGCGTWCVSVASSPCEERVKRELVRNLRHVLSLSSSPCPLSTRSSVKETPFNNSHATYNFGTRVPLGEQRANVTANKACAARDEDVPGRVRLLVGGGGGCGAIWLAITSCRCWSSGRRGRGRRGGCRGRQSRGKVGLFR